jgi:hypothetical protein
VGLLSDLPVRISRVYFFLKQMPIAIHDSNSITRSLVISLHGKSPCHSKVQESIVGPSLCRLAGCIAKDDDVGGVICVREGASVGIVPRSKADAVMKCQQEHTSGCDVVDQFLEETGCVGECMEQEGLHSSRQKLCSAATTEADCQTVSIPCNDAGSSTPPGA